MIDKVDAFIAQKLAKHSEIVAGIFKEIINKYPDETLRQHAIRAAVLQFERQYPDVMDEFDRHMKKKKELAKNEHAADYDNDLRLDFAIPDGLETRIQLLFNNIGQQIRFLSDESEKAYGEKLWFSKSFPRFVVPMSF